MNTQPDCSGLQVLLIEDNPADAWLFKEFVSTGPTQACHVVHVETIAEALEALSGYTPDVIVLDLTLPDARHLDGLRKLVDATASAPIVVHSGLDDHHLIEQAVKEGAQDYLVKGRYDAELLDRIIRYAIERQQSLRIVQESEQRLRSIIEHTSDGVVIVRPSKKMVFANPAAEHLLGSSAEVLLMQPFYFPLTLDEPTELETVNAAGRLVTVEMRVTPIFWEGEDAYLASLRDITAHKQLQDQLTRSKEEAEELARLKSSFLASMSHELRTPLTGIMGFADTLISEMTDAQHREFAQIIRGAGDRLLATINSVLDLSQLEAGTVTVKREPALLMDLVQESLALLEPMAREKGLSVSMTTHIPETEIYTDSILFHRILDNLLGNAIKFTEQGGIHIDIGAEEHQIVFQIEDTGIGIDPAFMPRLFEQFTQENGGIRQSHPGSGLGLAITKKLVTLLDGTISVVSEVGVGSVFTVTLPANQPQNSLKEAPRTPAHRARPLPTRAPIAEKHAEVRNPVTPILAPPRDYPQSAEPVQWWPL